jgi:hypothetical protein
VQENWIDRKQLNIAVSASALHSNMGAIERITALLFNQQGALAQVRHRLK